MIPCTAYMEVPLRKNLDFPRSLNPPFLAANPMPRKKKPPLTEDAKASEGEEKEGIGYVPLKQTLPAEHLTIECRMVEQKKPPATSGMWLLGVSL